MAANRLPSNLGGLQRQVIISQIHHLGLGQQPKVGFVKWDGTAACYFDEDGQPMTRPVEFLVFKELGSYAGDSMYDSGQLLKLLQAIRVYPPGGAVTLPACFYN